MKKCFIVCPIGPDGSETRKRSDKLLRHIIKPICDICGFEAIRVDELNHTDSITETILNHLLESDLVIADLTEHNPNAFYEIGYRSALRKPMIHLKEKEDTIPFDVSAIRTFDYDLTDLDSVEELKNRLIQTVNSFPFDENQNISNDIRSSSESFNSQILQEIFKIQDSIKELSSNLSTTDTSAISVLADKLASTGSKSTETALIESILPTLLNEPNKFADVLELMKKYPQLN